MAKVIAPLHSIRVVGTLAGVTFKRWRDLNLATDRPAGNPSEMLDDGCAAMRAGAAAWGTLTNDQRAAWNKYAEGREVGDGILKPTRWPGYFWYRQAYYFAVMVGESAPALPWAGAPPGAPAGLGLEVNGSGYWEVTWSAAQAADYVGVRCEINRPVTRRFYDYRLGPMLFGDAADEGMVFDSVLASGKARAAVCLITDEGQWGFTDYVEAVA